MAPLVDLGCAPISAGSLYWLAAMRRIGNVHLPLHRRLYRTVGVYPTLDHYYESFPCSNEGAAAERDLPGIDWNVAEQLEQLSRFAWAHELTALPHASVPPPGYFYNNASFGPGDAETLYSMIRLNKPKTLVEIGAGASTMVAIAAIAANRSEDSRYACEHICIEPFECAWLEKAPVKLLRSRVERLDSTPFSKLGANDILFVDSSHVIRPGGDVLFEILQVLPTLGKGVLIHFHDIFSPRDYPASWRQDELRTWNEQYLLEAFLSQNQDFCMVAALNFLYHRHPAELRKACPVLAANWEREPASLWLRRV